MSHICWIAQIIDDLKTLNIFRLCKSAIFFSFLFFFLPLGCACLSTGSSWTEFGHGRADRSEANLTGGPTGQGGAGHRARGPLAALFAPWKYVCFWKQHLNIWLRLTCNVRMYVCLSYRRGFFKPLAPFEGWWMHQPHATLLCVISAHV